jgi:hypothetical protein
VSITKRMIEERIAKDLAKREPEWTESIAVGSEEFVREVAQRIKGRQELEIQPQGEHWCLREAPPPDGCSNSQEGIGWLRIN